MIIVNEEEDMFLQDNCIDNLSDVPIEFENSEEIEDSTNSDRKQNDVESDLNMHVQRIWRTIRQLIEESDENYDIEWSDFDLSKNNNEFKGSPCSMYFSCISQRDIQNMQDL